MSATPAGGVGAADGPARRPGSPRDDAKGIAAAITEVSERATLLVREEIELAKAEVTEKADKARQGRRRRHRRGHLLRHRPVLRADRLRLAALLLPADRQPVHLLLGLLRDGPDPRHPRPDRRPDRRPRGQTGRPADAGHGDRGGAPHPRHRLLAERPTRRASGAGRGTTRGRIADRQRARPLPHPHPRMAPPLRMSSTRPHPAAERELPPDAPALARRDPRLDRGQPQRARASRSCSCAARSPT